MRPLFVSLVLSAAACAPADDNTILGPDTPALEVSLQANGDGPPATSGPRVVRFALGIGVTLTDPAAGLTVTYGFDPVAACNGGGTLDVMDLMLVTVDEDQGRLKLLLKGDDVRTAVWPFASEVFDCGLFTANAPVAVGESDLVNTDNDVFPSPENRNRGVFGYSAHGRLQLASGATSQFSSHTRCRIDQVDPTQLRCTEKIHLAPR